MPGAFIAGSIIAFIFMRRRSRDAELPGAGDQIAAIKLLRASAGVDLKTAQQIVDTIRASPLARQ